MINSIQKKYYWQNMRKDIDDYVKRCEDCQKQKFSNRNTRDKMVITTTATTSFEKVYLDIVGPLEVDNAGYKYILTLQCELTKYVEAYPLENKDAQTVARAFVENFVLRYGIPKTLATDCGTEFINSTLREVCELLKVEKINSTPYHHESIGSLENWHKHLGSYLRIQTRNFTTNWSSWVQYWCFAYNTSVNTSTKYSPHELVFGKACNVPSNLVNRVEPLYVYDHYPLELKYRLQKAHSDARNNLILSKIQRKIKYDCKANVVNFKIGDLVLIKNECYNKLNDLYLGPYKIKDIKGSNLKVIKNNIDYLVHKNRVKLYHQ
jgi:hypothetical protein